MTRKKTELMARKKIKNKSTPKITISSNDQKMKLLLKKVQTVFEIAGFTYVQSDHHTMHIGFRDIEIDMLYVYENILIICEDTCDSHKIEHAMKKQEAFAQIENNRQEFFECLASEFPNQKHLFRDYLPDEYKIIYLYFTIEDIGFDDEQKKRFNLIRFVNPESVEYLYQMTNCIQKSARYEVFRFLQITDDDIGTPSSAAEKQQRIKAAIITPQGFTGLKNGVRIVSFMMRAEDLIKNCYVMRKDNWEESAFLYQRLIKKDRINKIRDYLIKRETAFLNNIIVSLPDDIQFYDSNYKNVALKDINTHGVYTMEIPDKMNSICVIDGQHRIYAHYESLEKDANEARMERMRKRLHLLVTGIIFPNEMTKIDRKKFESQLFLDINTNAKAVSPEVLTHIEHISNPLSPTGLARAVLEQMNKKGPLAQKLEISSLKARKIKTSTIIKFALNKLVDINDDKNQNFYKFWEGNKDQLLAGNEEELNSYIDFCASNLNCYFNAVHEVFHAQWQDDNSKLLSVVSINGFIIAYGFCMQNQGIKEYAFYKKALEKVSIDFAKENFPYTSSQYNKFAREILNPCFVSSIE